MKIRALSTDTGGCHFYRIRTPLTALRRSGHDTAWGTGVTASDLDSCDVLIGQFLNGEADLAGWESVAAAPRGKRPLLVYETDDDLFTIDQVITAEVTRKKVLWAEPETQARVRRFIELADLVTTTSPHLAKLYSFGGKPVAVLPNSIPDWMLDFPAVTGPSAFTIGWTLSHSHLLDAREHIASLEKFMARHGSARFEWHGPPRVVGGFAPWQQSCHPWVGDVNEYLVGMYGRLSVGIAPLGSFEFNKGKSGIKADEYAAFGVPCLASNFPQYHDTIVDGVTGWLIKKDWNEKLSRLYDDRSLAVKMGQAAKEHVADRVISRTCVKWTDAYQEAIDNG